MINQRVFLHKNLIGAGFNILDARMKLLYEGMSFVKMTDVTFVICEKNKQIFKETGNKTQHAWVEGILVDALPKHLRLTEGMLKLIDTGIPVEYRSSKDQGFVIAHNQTPIEVAGCIVGYNGRIKVVP